MRLVLLVLSLVAGAAAAVPTADERLAQALTAEAEFNTARALALYLELANEQPANAFLAHKVAERYSDAAFDAATTAEKLACARQALAYAERARALEPAHPRYVLAVAICLGEAALHSDLRTRVAAARDIRTEAERALALAPNDALAHHVLGRWHTEVADIGATGRLFARMLYGKLPAASREDGLRHLRRAVELDPASPLYRIELGFACRGAGLRQEASAHWRAGVVLPARDRHERDAHERARAALAK